MDAGITDVFAFEDVAKRFGLKIKKMKAMSKTIKSKEAPVVGLAHGV